MRKIIPFIGILFLIFAPFAGQEFIAFGDILEEGLNAHIFWELRLPRVTLTFFCGAGLALSGLIFQTLFRNALATPYTLGIASGATFGSAVAIKFHLGITLLGVSTTALFGFAGALVSIVILLLLSSRFKDIHSQSILLLGIALSFFYSSCILVLLYLGSFVETYSIVRYTMGSLAGFESGHYYLLIPATLLILVMAYYFRHELKLLSISHECAYFRGVDIEGTTRFLLLGLSLGIGTIVSITGPIGFVGLIVPNLMRIVYHQNIEKLFLKTFLAGGVFLVFCDMLARMLTHTSELPIGVVTALFGAPFFIYLILNRRILK